jgi:hypothetical protein
VARASDLEQSGGALPPPAGNNGLAHVRASATFGNVKNNDPSLVEPVTG